jgi:predicted RNA-binding protein (TIGR00451 family)
MVNARELTTLKRAFHNWGIFDFFPDKEILVNETDDKTKEIYILAPMAKKILCGKQAYCAGLKIGELKKKFLPSMQGADIIARNSRKFSHIVVDEKAEKLVLYGRDVLGSSIMEISEKLTENDIVVILNKNREAIGIGRTRFPAQLLLQLGKVTVTTILDAGYYLREENS